MIFHPDNAESASTPSSTRPAIRRRRPTTSSANATASSPPACPTATPAGATTSASAASASSPDCGGICTPSPPPGGACLPTRRHARRDLRPERAVLRRQRHLRAARSSRATPAPTTSSASSTSCASPASAATPPRIERGDVCGTDVAAVQGRALLQRERRLRAARCARRPAVRAPRRLQGGPGLHRRRCARLARRRRRLQRQPPTPSPAAARPRSRARPAPARPSPASRRARSSSAPATPTATTASIASRRAATATTSAASTPPARATTSAPPICSASAAPATRPATSCARRRQCSGEPRRARRTATQATPRSAQVRSSSEPRTANSRSARPMAQRSLEPSPMKTTSLPRGARRVADLALAHRAAPAGQLGVRKVDLDAPSMKRVRVEVAALERAPAARPGAPRCRSRSRPTPATAPPPRAAPPPTARRAPAADGRSRARRRAPRHARQRASAHICRCASGSEISLRTHAASMSRHAGGANRSQISSPMSFCVTVPSKSNTITRLCGVTDRYIYRGSRHEADENRSRSRRQAGAVPDEGSRADPPPARGELDLQMNDLRVDDLLDDINTDAMTPAWACFDWRPADIARNAYAGLMIDGQRLFPEGALADGNFEVIVSGQRKGVGSSRETAVQAEKWSRHPHRDRRRRSRRSTRATTSTWACSWATTRCSRRLQAGEPIALDGVHARPGRAHARRSSSTAACSRSPRRSRAARSRCRRSTRGARPMTMAEKILARHARRRRRQGATSSRAMPCCVARRRRLLARVHDRAGARRSSPRSTATATRSPTRPSSPSSRTT